MNVSNENYQSTVFSGIAFCYKKLIESPLNELPCLLCGFTLILTYIPVAWFRYGFSDDYYYLYQIISSNSNFTLFITSGRPITGYFTDLVFGLIGNIDRLHYLRLINVFGISLMGMTLYFLLRSFMIDKTFALALATLLCLTPSIQLFSAWTTAFIYPYGIILAIVSGRLVISNKNILLSFIFPTILLSLSFLIYQPAGMYYWVVITAYILLNFQYPIKEWARKLIKFSCVWIITGSISFISVKIATSIHPGMAERSNIVLNFWEKVKWFLQEPLLRSMNPFLIEDSTLYAAVVGIVILIGLLLHFQVNLRKKILLTGLSLFFIPISYFPNLVIAENWGSYRSQVALSGVIIVLLMFSLRTILLKINMVGRRYRILLAISILALSIQASHNVLTRIAIPQEIEYRYLMSQVVSHDLSNISKIRIVRAHWKDSLEISTYDEFGLPSSYASFALLPMIRLVLLNKTPAYATIPIVVLPPEFIHIPGQETNEISTLTIDMRNLNTFR